MFEAGPLQDMNRAGDMSLGCTATGVLASPLDGSPGYCPTALILRDKKGTAFAVLESYAPAGNGRRDRRSLTPNASANLFRFAFVLYCPVLLVDVVNVLVRVHAGSSFPVRLGKLRRFRRAAAHFKCGDSSFEVA